MAKLLCNGYLSKEYKSISVLKMDEIEIVQITIYRIKKLVILLNLISLKSNTIATDLSHKHTQPPSLNGSNRQICHFSPQASVVQIGHFISVCLQRQIEKISGQAARYSSNPERPPGEEGVGCPQCQLDCRVLLLQSGVDARRHKHRIDAEKKRNPSTNNTPFWDKTLLLDQVQSESPGPKRRLGPGTRHSCRRISLPPLQLTVQTANPAAPPPSLKINVKGLLKWMDVNRSGLRFFSKCLVVTSITAESDTSLTILDLMQQDGREEDKRGDAFPGERLDCRAVVAATRTMESSYENEVGVIDWVVRNGEGMSFRSKQLIKINPAEYEGSLKLQRRQRQKNLTVCLPVVLLMTKVTAGTKCRRQQQGDAISIQTTGRDSEEFMNQDGPRSTPCDIFSCDRRLCETACDSTSDLLPPSRLFLVTLIPESLRLVSRQDGGIKLKRLNEGPSMSKLRTTKDKSVLYLSDLLKPYIPSCALCSCRSPRVKTISWLWLFLLAAEIQDTPVMVKLQFQSWLVMAASRPSCRQRHQSADITLI
ncbi:hypothetical protein EXN66_Car016425 [Channa argus]|uniref:Uncharacterized protein n=1 Tax=Channa argus TaxID=215402 RepID=A0A6G1QE30_CHAAH|nr:hypothetical protein EXN66_Car016425 [Channa argus]